MNWKANRPKGMSRKIVAAIILGIVVAGIGVPLHAQLQGPYTPEPASLPSKSSDQVELALPAPLAATRLPDGRIQSGQHVYETWADYRNSADFAPGRKCGAPAQTFEDGPRAPGDCSMNFTNPSAVYDPSVVKYRIPVVVHVLTNTAGDGHMSEANVRAQIDTLNEDFLALAGTPGEDGTDVQIEFFLATRDPNNNPTNGIIFHDPNNAYFLDTGPETPCDYCAALSWDTNRYLNIYTADFTDPDLLGYVDDFPAAGIAGSVSDRVVVRYLAFGPDGLFPNHLGRTLTHEVGHYLGLFHTFHNGFGCPSGNSPQCYSQGDCICDTLPEASESFFCNVGIDTCPTRPGLDDISNYMNYSDDACLTHFTPEQVRRMRCTLESYRSNLYQIANPNAGACCLLNQTCITTAAADCATTGGLFRGAGVNCTPTICSPDATPGDTCGTAPRLTTSFTDADTTVGRAGHYGVNGTVCANLFDPESGMGPDVVYEVVVPGGGNVAVTLTPSPTADLSVYAVTDCSATGTSCVGGDDFEGPGGTESFSFAAASDVSYFVIVDGYFGDAGSYQINVSITGGPTGACCLPTGACATGQKGACESFGGTYEGNGTTCQGVNCPAPPPTGACCDGVGNCTVVTESQCQTAGHSYEGDFTGCTPLPCGDPVGACCAPSDACSETVRSACFAGGGTFNGAGTTCTQPLCADIAGACCLPDGSCDSILKNDCVNMDGVFKGHASLCANVLCPQPTGACCTPGSPCTTVVRQQCENGGGTYQGDATSCSPSPCPQDEPTGGCCRADGSCEMMSESECSEVDGNYRGNSIACTTELCPQPTGACCFGGGACSVIGQSACLSATGEFAGAGTTCATGCNDACPDDPDKTEPGECGCGLADTDTDGDGTPDCDDQCKDDASKVLPGNCGCGTPESAGCPTNPPIGSVTPCCAASGAELAAAPFFFACGLGLIRHRFRRRR